MPPTKEDRLRDILEAIVDIEQLWSGRTFNDFVADRIGRLATERILEIVCEASRRLPDDLKNSAREIDWRNLVDFGNVLRHAYHQTKTDRVWKIVEGDLPVLKAFAQRHISR